jgi:hypothetical protein
MMPWPPQSSFPRPWSTRRRLSSPLLLGRSEDSVALIERARLNTFGQGTLSREHLLEPVNWSAAGQE